MYKPPAMAADPDIVSRIPEIAVLNLVGVFNLILLVTWVLGCKLAEAKHSIENVRCINKRFPRHHRLAIHEFAVLPGETSAREPMNFPETNLPGALASMFY